jgi:hypothetical protein
VLGPDEEQPTPNVTEKAPEPSIAVPPANCDDSVLDINFDHDVLSRLGRMESMLAQLIDSSMSSGAGIVHVERGKYYSGTETVDSIPSPTSLIGPRRDGAHMV